YGGTAAPNLLFHGDPIEFPHPQVEIEEQDSDESNQLFPQHPETNGFQVESEQVWNEINELDKDLAQQTSSEHRIYGGNLDFADWGKLHGQAAAFSVTHQQSSASHSDLKKKLKLRLNRFSSRELESQAERIIASLDFGEKEASDSNNLNEPQKQLAIVSNQIREVAQIFQDVHELRFRVQHDVAFFDSLSWILPDESQNLCSEYADDLIRLLKLLRSEEIDWDAPPTLDDFNEIKSEHREIMKCEKDLNDHFKDICELTVPDLDAFHREMAVEIALRFPFLPADVENENNPLPTRSQLCEILQTNKLNNDQRVTPSSRKKASQVRANVYQEYRKLIRSPENGNEASRLLQVAAYLMPTDSIDFETFSVADRTVIARAEITNLEELQEIGQIIERRPTELGMRLQSNVPVVVRYQLYGDEIGFADESQDVRQKQVAGTELVNLVAANNATDGRSEVLNGIQVTVLNTADLDETLIETFQIPLKLPSANEIELIVMDAEGLNKVFRHDQPVSQVESSDPVFCLPNRDFTFQFGLKNLWHQSRQGTIRLYACEQSVSPSIPGKINREVQSQTRKAIDRNLQPLAEYSFNLKGKSDPVSIQWKVSEESQGKELEIKNGFFCTIEGDAIDESWEFWIPIFVLERSVARVDLVNGGGDLQLQVKREPTLSVDESVQINWHSTNDIIPPGKATLKAGVDSDTIKVASNVSGLRSRLADGEDLFLYVDIDGWPRKYIYKFDGNRFVQPSSIAQASVELVLGDPKKPIQPVSLTQERGFDQVLGINQKLDNARVDIKMDAPSNRFSFQSGEDVIRLKESGDAGLLNYPRQVSYRAQVAKSGGLIVSAGVRDHQLELPIVGSRFEIKPRMILDGNEVSFQGTNRVLLRVDRKDPEIEDYDIVTQKIYPGRQVRVEIKASDPDGVGLDWDTGVEIYVSDKNARFSRALDGKPQGKFEGNQTFLLTAPKEPGNYILGVKVTDRVGNFDEDIKDNKVVMKVLPPPGSQVDSTGAPAKVFKHTLMVELTDAFQLDLSNAKVTIQPEDAKAVSIGNGKFAFQNLNGGKVYSVNAQFTMSSGIAKGRVIKGSATVKFPARSKSSLTKTTVIQVK
ncbi:MAG: hypothetical protein AAF939_21690, partial [Planctomycetota bacterium]